MKTRFSAIAAIAILILTFGASACGGGGTRILEPDPGPIVNPPPPPPPPPDPLPTLGSVTRIYAFGDSLTEGKSKGQLLWNPRTATDGTPGISTGYPFKLQEILDEVYGDGAITVINGGLGGERAGFSATESRMVSEINQYDPHVVLFMHGVNDLNAGVQSGDDDDEIVSDAINAVEELIEVAKVTGSPRPHIMVGSLPRQISTSKALSGRLIVPYNNILADVASEEGATFVDIYKVVSTAMLMPDGLHLTEAGNEKVAETFYAALKAKYHKAPATIR